MTSNEAAVNLMTEVVSVGKLTHYMFQIALVASFIVNQVKSLNAGVYDRLLKITLHFPYDNEIASTLK